jgi:signal transduction histidine kinase
MFRDLQPEQVDNLTLIGELVKGVAHNINTPLSAISGRAEMLQFRLHKLKDKYEKKQEIEEEALHKTFKDVEQIIKSAYKISDIVRNTMQKCLNEQSYQIQSINLGTLLKEELQFFEANLDFKHNIEKVYHINEKIRPIMGIYSHFSNSFLHIIKNCIQAISNTQEKRINISLDSDEKNITVTFHDNGCGIEPEKRDQLIEILHNSAPDALGKAGQEAGIKRIAQLLKPYNPFFSITSKPGDTTFTITFPQ